MVIGTVNQNPFAWEPFIVHSRPLEIEKFHAFVLWKCRELLPDLPDLNDLWNCVITENDVTIAAIRVT